MVQNLKKVLKSKISKKNSFLRHEVPFKANNNREAVVVCARHVVKRPSKRSVLVINKLSLLNTLIVFKQFINIILIRVITAFDSSCSLVCLYVGSTLTPHLYQTELSL